MIRAHQSTDPLCDHVAIKSPDFNLRNICYFTVIVNNNNSKIRRHSICAGKVYNIEDGLRTNYVNVASYNSISFVCMHALPKKKYIFKIEQN